MEPVVNESKFKFPTEQVELPSKGLIYPPSNPLSSGFVEMKYMTAREEDILTNQNYIKQGVVLEKLLQSLIVSKVNYDDLIVGDKNAIMVAARILGYGKDYKFTYKDEEVTVDLSELDLKYLNPDLIEKGKNEFKFYLPHSGNEITYKLLTGHDEKEIDKEIQGLKKINKNISPEMSTRLKYMITSINGDTNKKDIREFVDNMLLARDSKALRDHIKNTQPDVNLTFNFEGVDGTEEGINIPITINFFWPDTEL
jgi:hypothetical protein